MAHDSSGDLNSNPVEDDDEIEIQSQSHPPPASGSPPASPLPNGRITVTVASVAPAAPSNNALTLALPVQQRSGGGGREDCWSEGATAVLIEAWGERYLELSRGNLKQKHWKEVADIVSRRENYGKIPKTDIQCKNRIDTVKKKYKSEKAKVVAGGGPSKWPFYDRLEHLVGPTAKISPAAALHKVPVGIPVGIRPIAQYHPTQGTKIQNQNPPPKQKIQIRRSRPVDSESSPENSPDSTDSFPPEPYERKRPKIVNPNPSSGGGRKEKDLGNSMRELTGAILKLGEAYEQAENSKLQQMVEMEKQRMKFAKELELQKMHFFMKTQLELSQLKHGRRINKNNN